MLTKEQILAAVDLETESVAVPEWGGDVLVSQMSGAMRDTYEDFKLNLPVGPDGETFTSTKGLRELAVGLCLVDENGERLFSDAELHELGKKSADAIDRLWEVVLRVNKLGKAQVEDTEKNSEGEPSEDSG